MSSRARKVDLNQSEIVDAFRQAGAGVRICSSVGDGHPDLIVSWHGWVPPNRYVEVKSAKGKRTPAQARWIEQTNAEVHTVRSVNDALELLGVQFQVIDMPGRRIAQAHHLGG